MNRLLANASWRFYARHPWQLALAICGVALGVAVYVGVDVANDSARRAFAQSADIVLGETTHRLLPAGGDLPENIYTQLVTEQGLQLAAPVIEAELRLAHAPGRRFTLLGIDPLAEGAFRGYAGFIPDADADFERLIVEPGTVLAPRTELLSALQPGTMFSVIIDGRPASVELAGFIAEGAAGSGGEPPFVADIATAQELTGRAGLISRIDLILDDQAAAQLAQQLPAGSVLVPASSETDAFADLTRAFHINLQALGLLALVVGVFLIYATMSFAIVQRREQFGVLRALGIARGELLGGVLIEAAVIGAIATAVGLVLGHLLALGLVSLMLGTLADLYFSTAVTPAPPSMTAYLTGAALGVLGTVLASLAPAAEAAAAAPDTAMRRSALERIMRSRSRGGLVAAAISLAIAANLLMLGPATLTVGFGALFFILTAGAALTPAATASLMTLLSVPARRLFGLNGVMVVRGVTASLSRTGVATAALAVAVAAVVGVGLMIASFRVSLVAWLDATLAADLYVSYPANGASDGFSDEDIASLLALQGVSAVSPSRFLQLPTPHGEVSVRALAPGTPGWGITLMGGDPESAVAALERGEAVIVTEPLAWRWNLAVNDTLELTLPDGPHRFTIAGISRDYNTGGGIVMASLPRLQQHWETLRPATAGLHLERGIDPDTLADAVRRRMPGVAVRSTHTLRDISLQVFDRTFTITEVLRILAGLIAFLGVLSALLAIQLERLRELSVMRSIGFTPGELARQVLSQTALLGLAAGLIALPLGTALSLFLTQVINRRSFGWTMDFIITPGPLIGAVALAVGAALLAGLYPARRAAVTEAAKALHDE